MVALVMSIIALHNDDGAVEATDAHSHMTNNSAR